MICLLFSQHHFAFFSGHTSFVELQSKRGCCGGGDHCETTLEAKSTANHCGGTALLSDWRAWAVELGLGEINGLMVLVPGTRPCQLERGVVRDTGCGTQ